MRNKGFILLFLCIILSLFLFIPSFAFTSVEEFGTYWEPVIKNGKMYRKNGDTYSSIGVSNGMSKDYSQSSMFDGIGYLYYNMYLATNSIANIASSGSPVSYTVSGSDLQYATSESEHTYNTVQYYSLPFNLQNLNGNYFTFSLAVFGANTIKPTYGFNSYEYTYNKYSDQLSNCYIDCYFVDSSGKVSKLQFGKDFLVGNVVTDTTFTVNSNLSKSSFSARTINFKVDGIKDIAYLYVYVYTDTTAQPDLYNSNNPVIGRWAPYSGIAFVSESVVSQPSPTPGEQQIVVEIEELNQKMDTLLVPTNEQIEDMNQIKKDNQDSKDNLTNLGNSLDVPKPDPSDIWGIVDTDDYDSSLVNNTFKDFLSGPLISSMLAFTFLFAFFGYVLYGKKGT